MAKINKYEYTDPNAGNLTRSAEGDSHTILAYAPCNSGQAIKIYDGSAEVLFSCLTPSSLVITPIQIDPSQKFDCVNGGCIPATTYKTPGVFGSLAACESGCAKNSNCTGECVSVEEIAALQQATNNLQAKNCK